MNLRGYFRSLDTSIDSAGTLYRVDIITDNLSAYTEVQMAADSPFTVSYTDSSTPFEPLRISTATARIVIGDSIPNIFSPYAQAVQVKLYKQVSPNNFSLEWAGYLKSNLYNQTLINCNDIIDLEASDCVASLQYFDYTTVNGTTKQTVSIKQLLNNICNQCGLLDGYFIADTKQINGVSISQCLTAMTISEGNFFSSDIDKPWTYSEVLEELAKYLGYTAIQWNNKLYFIDYAYWGSHTTMSGTVFLKANGYNNPTTEVLNIPPKITEDKLRGSGTELSYDTIYNKVVVNDSLYKVEYFIPDVFADENLTNRYGDFNTYVEIEPQLSVSSLPPWPFMFGNGYRPIYITRKGKQGDDADDSKKRYYRRAYDNKYWNSVYYTSGGNSVNLTDEQKASSACTKEYIGATIVDFASVDKQDDTYNPKTQVEANGNVSFERYIMINQMDYPNSETELSPTTGSYSLNRFKKVMELAPGYSFPVILDGNNSFLTLNCTAIFERYQKHDYINSDWTDENVGTGFLTGAQIFKKYKADNTYPKLYFLLKIGDKYWDGSRWTTYETGFLPETEFSKDEDNEIDWRNWNKELKLLNNVDWQEGAGQTGYKIPLDTSLDMNAEIKFEIHLPSRLCVYYSTNGGDLWLHDGMNNYCWLKDFSLKLTTAGAENSNDNDLIFENVIESGSTNELDEISLKITTWAGSGPLSLSHMGYNKGFLTAIKDLALSASAQKPEENIIERYVAQFSTPTKKMGYTTDLTYSPLCRLSEGIFNGNYVILGQSIDYAMNSQDITILQIKDLTLGDLSDELTFQREGLETISQSGGSAYFTVLSNHPWTVSAVTAGMGTLSTTGGTGNGVTQSFTYTFNSNGLLTKRKQTIKVSNGFQEKSIDIWQDTSSTALTIFSYNNSIIGDKITNIDAHYYSSYQDVFASSVEAVTATTADSWITITDRGGGAFRVTYANNPDTADRNGSITFTNPYTSVTVTVTQTFNNTLKVTLNTFGLVKPTGGVIQYTVNSATPWTATTDCTFGSFIKNTGSDGDVFAFQVDENKGAQRGLNFTVENSLGTVVTTPYTYQQAANIKYTYFSLSADTYDTYGTVIPPLSETGGTYTYYVHSNQEWVVPTSNINGINYYPLRGNAGVTQCTLTVNQSAIREMLIVNAYAADNLTVVTPNSNVLFIKKI